MRIAWFIVLVSALTDFGTAFATGLLTAMTASGSGDMPGKGTLLVCFLGGAVAGCRSIQNALKSPENTSMAIVKVERLQLERQGVQPPGGEG